MLTGKQIIGFQFEASGTQTFHAIDPASGEILAGEFFEGTPADVDRAAVLAARDFDAIRRIDNDARAAFLETIAAEIMGLGEALIERTLRETGLPRARLEGERARTVNQLKLFAAVVREGSWEDVRIDTADPSRQPLPKPDVRMRHIPLGPVAVFGASNFPLAFSVAGGDTASALAAGCPVIVKGHPAHPGTCELVARAVQTAVKKCALPEGTFSMVQGSDYTVGQSLVQHPAVKAVGFTGSFHGGKALFDLAAARPEPIPVFAEMGSTNPVFLLPGALKAGVEEIARGLADSVTLGVGQFCTNPGLVLGIQNSDFEDFVQAAARAIGEKPAGTMLHRGIKQAYEAGLQELLAVETVELVGKGSGSTAESQATPQLLRASGQVFLKNPRLEEEVFGPSSILIACRSRGEMLQIANNLRGHLTATILGAEPELAEYRDLITILERKAGRLIFNGFPTGVEVCHAMVHGGPYPATTDSRATSVGTAAIRRFLRPVCYQNFPDCGLPASLRNDNPATIWRLVNGEWQRGELPK